MFECRFTGIFGATQSDPIIDKQRSREDLHSPPFKARLEACIRPADTIEDQLLMTIKPTNVTKGSCNICVYTNHKERGKEYQALQ
jgi:hypothetical protein